MFNIDQLCASGTEVAVNVLSIIMAIGAGVLVLVLIIDALFAMLGNSNGIFFKSSKAGKEQEQTQAVEQEYVQEKEEEKEAEENLAVATEEPYNNIDY